ncbi:MAG: hypothetical protein KDI83_18430 [Gammaproteobacteria bacterium]|nr:hypothetical protein [Gammaproteobacteria bacterium]
MSKPVSRDNKRMGCIVAALDFERELVNRGAVPDVDKLIHARVRPYFEIIGAILLALGITSMSLLGNFLVFNLILHWTF